MLYILLFFSFRGASYPLYHTCERPNSGKKRVTIVEDNNTESSVWTYVIWREKKEARRLWQIYYYYNNLLCTNQYYAIVLY